MAQRYDFFCVFAKNKLLLHSFCLSDKNESEKYSLILK